jgi:hypothetical protein
MERNDAPPDAKPFGTEPEAPSVVRTTTGLPGPGMTPDQAMQMLGAETNKRRRVATATQSGSRLVTIGLALGVAGGLSAWLLPASLAIASWAIGVIALLVGGFGALKLLAAWQLGRS